MVMRLLRTSVLMLVVCVTAQAASAQSVRVFGNWPADSFCVRDFPISAQRQVIDGACNDKTSTVQVPFGVSVEVCEHDGQGEAGLGRCRRFLPGTYFVGSDFNDIATSFLVERRMVAYLNSADLPTSWQIGVSLSGPTDGPLKPGMIIGSDGGGMNMFYDVPLQPGCKHPKLLETTKANQASWSGGVANNRLKLTLHVDYKGLLGANNWVGVEIQCHP